MIFKRIEVMVPSGTSVPSMCGMVTTCFTFGFSCAAARATSLRWAWVINTCVRLRFRMSDSSLCVYSGLIGVSLAPKVATDRHIGT